MEPEFKASSTYGAVEGTSLMYCLLTLDKMNPYYDAGEKAMRSTHMHGRSPLSANNNLKIFTDGAERVDYTKYATGPYCTNAEPYDGRPGSIQDGFNFQGDKHGSKWSTLVREIPRTVDTGLCDLHPENNVIKIIYHKSGKADAVL